MRKLYLLYSVHILLSSLAAKAQNELPGERIDTQITMRCGFQDIMADEEREKLPYFGNNDYLFEVLRKKAGVDVGKNYLKEVERRGYIPFRVDDYSVGDLSSYEQSSNMSLMNALPLTNVVPVTVWIYRRNDGTGGITQAQAEAIMAGVRNIFDPTGIRIYMLCQVQFVNSTQFFTLDNRNEFLQMVAQNRVGTNLNVHLVNMLSFGDGTVGTATPPTDPANQRYACAVGIAQVADAEANVLAHEIGHTLGLWHTHHPRYDSNRPWISLNGECVKCHQESVSRSRTQGILCYKTFSKTCEVNGDMLCDTPADPGLNPDAVRPNCTLDRLQLWSAEDRWGDQWTPNVRNVMAYGRFSCLSTFTALQVAIMLDNLSPSWTNPAAITGPSSLCAGQTGDYFAPNNGATYQWIVPAGWTVVSGQGTRQARIRAGSNTGTIRANPSCGNPVLSFGVDVFTNAVSIDGPSSICPYSTNQYSVTQYPGASYTWSASGDVSIVMGQGTNRVTVAANSNFNSGYIYASYTMTNGCSGGGGKTVYRHYSCGQNFAMAHDTTAIESPEILINTEEQENIEDHLRLDILYPNPSGDQIIVKMQNAGFYGIQLTDSYGNEMFADSFESDSITIPVESYPNGLYFLKIVGNNRSVVKRVLIQK